MSQGIACYLEKSVACVDGQEGIHSAVQGMGQEMASDGENSGVGLLHIPLLKCGLNQSGQRFLCPIVHSQAQQNLRRVLKVLDSVLHLRQVQPRPPPTGERVGEMAAAVEVPVLGHAFGCVRFGLLPMACIEGNPPSYGDNPRYIPLLLFFPHKG